MNVSVIIPCKNEERYIAKCIDSILQSDYPNELISIYVCDGLSNDKTPEIVREIAKQHNNVHLLINQKETTPYALNLGLKTSTADVKIILGAHAEVDTAFIAENVKVLNKYPEVGCSGGIIINVFENETSEVIGTAMSSPFGVGNAHFRTGQKDGFVDTVAFGAYRKEVFEKIGYFDEELARNQDDEFNFRMLKEGFKIFLSKNIRSKYYVRASFNKLFRQYYQYGYWKVFVNKKHHTITTIRQLIPLFFVLFLLFAAVTSFVHPLLFGFNLSILVLYFAFAFIFAMKIAKKKKQIPRIIFTFLILHISYGWGYLMGIIDFVLLNKKPQKKDMKLTR